MGNHCFCTNPFPIPFLFPFILPTTEGVAGRFRNYAIIHLGLERCMRFYHTVKRDRSIPGRQKSIIGKGVNMYGHLWGVVMRQERGGRAGGEGVSRVGD